MRLVFRCQNLVITRGERDALNILTELFIKADLEKLCRISVIDHHTTETLTYRNSDDTYNAYQPTLIYY